ncbi:TonB-dependent receptor-like protein [Winogradskyella wandonensis]|uniref:TonB-dependent receptor-like protein n=1 Tax=Winogradskyella wandonensis TaxID=1442586 RepID=A0A4R1KU40_9FLAO|nr:M56 family metallopeptidase [Winogradskyella wandonensis]TCK68684.1 TonB-dependent receptor-like protein [Winogradskyella wandonensis]
MDYLLQSSALLLLMYLGYSLFLKQETFFTHNRWFLFFGILTAVLLPLVEIPVYVTLEPALHPSTPVEFIYAPTELIEEEKPFDWLQVLRYAYLLGVIIFFVQFIFQFGSLLFLLIKNAKNRDGIYTYVIVKNKISPFSFFKWIVYNPNLFSEDELQLILNHEKVHVRQWHSLDIIISRLACVAFWFNPLAWIYHKNIQQNLEYIADAETQKHLVSSLDYQQLLLKTSIGNTNINLTSNFYNSLIKKRIVMLQKHQSKSINRLKLLIVLPFIALFLMSFNTKEVFIETPTKINESEVIDTKVEVVFTNQMSDKRLDEMKEFLNKEGIKMTLTSLERNSEGLINKIDIKFDYDSSSTSYKADAKDGIKPFRFVKFENGMVMVGPANMDVIEVIEEPEVEEIIEIIEEPVIEIIEDEEEIEIEADSVYFIKTNPKTKAKYIFRTKDSIVAGKPKTAYTFKANGNVKVNSNSFTIKTDSINYKNTIRIRNSKGKDPIYIINGKVASKKDLKKMNPNKIAEVSVIKGDKATALYGKKGKDGVVEIKTKGKANKKKNVWQISKIEATDVFKSSTKEELKKFLSTANKPLITVNGDVLGNIDIKDLDYSIIESISIVDDKTATEIYGAKGKNGIVVITTNEAKNRFERLTQDNKDYKVQIGSVRFEDDNKNTTMTLHYITKDTQDKLMETHKKELAKKGITVKYSKLKRNKNGEIVRIKISVKDKDGNSSVGTFNNTNGIPTINFGKYGDDLVVSSNPL